MNRPARITWSAEQDDTLRWMAGEGKSGSDIGAVLGMTRNAVLGRASKLKIQLSSGKGGGARANSGRKPRTVQPHNLQNKQESRRNDPVETAQREWRTPEAIAYDATARLLTLMDLGPRDCKWPVAGEKADTRFCGHVRPLGSPYCAHHEARSAGRHSFLAEAV